ncbi:MAG: glycoside hydrolase family 2 TIM barrel-domain containing protein [Bacteroidales bacterium]
MYLRLRFLLILSLFLTIGFHLNAQLTLNLKNGWKFSKGPVENAAQLNFNDSKWQEVSIPHDWAISGPFIKEADGNTGKLPWKGEGWYRKQLDIPVNYTGKQIYLLFDGVMAFPEVYINGQLVGQWDYGYNSFYLNISKFIKPGAKNILAVHADTRKHDSRWYPGAGIYRKVQLIVEEPVHVPLWGIGITTPVVKTNYAEVRVMTTVLNQSSEKSTNVKVENIILSPDGIELDKKTINSEIQQGKSRDLETTLSMINPQRWDIDNPVLYTVKTTVYAGGKPSGTYYNTFGVRTIKFTANNGFYLNDRRVQLKGVCLHHDHGPLGGAFYKRAMERQIEIMKSMGCNAIRTSHNVPAPELLELCDKMGILVIDEIFDKYEKKADYIEGTDFEEFAHRNTKNFILRDRNHPSVFLWSVGNEIAEVQLNIDNGLAKMQTIIASIKKFDQTRPVTLVCDIRDAAVKRHFDYYDVISYNYGRRYDLARQLAPDKSVIITESASTVSTRGFYEFPLPQKKTDFTKSMQISSYDLNAPYWAEIPDDDFMWQQDEEYVAGEFVWTGFDYIGEPTPYSWYFLKEMGLNEKEDSYSSYFGIVDLCGIPKDRYYLYKSYWNTTENTVHILPHWNWKGKEGTKVPVFVYTNGDAAELFLNGKSLGMKYKKPVSTNSTERFRLMWNEVEYQPGELKAVAYKEGQKIGADRVKTAGEPYKLKLSADRNKISSGGEDLSYILVEALDKEGNPCPLADNLVEFSIKGNASIAGVGNGNPRSFEPFKADRIKLFYGKAMLIVVSGNEKGNVEITAASGGLNQAVEKIEIE